MYTVAVFFWGVLKQNALSQTHCADDNTEQMCHEQWCSQKVYVHVAFLKVRFWVLSFSVSTCYPLVVLSKSTGYTSIATQMTNAKYIKFDLSLFNPLWYRQRFKTCLYQSDTMRDIQTILANNLLDDLRLNMWILYIPGVSSGELLWCSPLLDGEQLRPIGTWGEIKKNSGTSEKQEKTNSPWNTKTLREKKNKAGSVKYLHVVVSHRRVQQSRSSAPAKYLWRTGADGSSSQHPSAEQPVQRHTRTHTSSSSSYTGDTVRDFTGFPLWHYIIYMTHHHLVEYAISDTHTLLNLFWIYTVACDRQR